MLNIPSCFVGHVYVFLEKSLFRSAVQFLTELFVFLILNYMRFLYILEINPLSVASFAVIFCLSEHCLFVFFMVSAPFFTIPTPAFIICRVFDDGHSGWCEVIPHCSL